MNEKEEITFFAAMAMIGLVMRGESPVETAEQAWIYAEFMYNHKPKDAGI
jgi:hypothetical protein